MQKHSASPRRATLARRALIALLSALLAYSALSAQTNGDEGEGANEVIIDEIVAKVNSDIITKTDLEEELGRIRRGFLSANPNNREKALQQFEQRRASILADMIINRMMYQRAEELGMLANMEQDVSGYIQGIMEENGIPSLDVFKQVLEQQGSSYEEFRQGIENQYVQSRLQNQFVFSKITILSDEVEAYYKEHIEQFTEPAEVELAEIVFLTEGKDIAEVRPRAEDVLARLEAGESFESLARQYSENEPTANRGGRIPGAFTRESLAEVLKEPAFSLEPGEFSGVLETDFGLTIIKVLSRTPERAKPLEEVRPQVVQALQQEKAGPYMKQFLDELRQESYVYVAPKYQEMFDVEEIL